MDGQSRLAASAGPREHDEPMFRQKCSDLLGLVLATNEGREADRKVCSSYVITHRYRDSYLRMTFFGHDEATIDPRNDQGGLNVETQGVTNGARSEVAGA